MKQLLLFFAAFAIAFFANSQKVVGHAQQGFDSLRANIKHGKLDTISYPLSCCLNQLTFHHSQNTGN